MRNSSNRRRNAKVAVATFVMVLSGTAMISTERSSAAARTADLRVEPASATRVAEMANGDGYWLVSASGRVYTFGSAKFYGSMLGRHLNSPITGIVATPSGHGYWLVAEDGGVFSFGDAVFSGSLGSASPRAGVVGMATTANGASAAGPRGLTGAKGATGSTGARGLIGATGAVGGTGATGAAGSNGAQGVAGVAGSTGAQGAAGPTGPQGATGATGANGLAGTNGTDGATGSTGATGPSGSSGVPLYAYAYNVAAQVVAIEADVIFSNNGPIAGFAHAPGTTTIVATVAGDYDVEFSVSGVEPAQFALMVNGVAVAGGIYGSGAGTQQDNGHAIVHLGVADTLTLRNHSSAAAVTLQTLAGGTQTNVNAALIIELAG
jgi:hypothetical protein